MSSLAAAVVLVAVVFGLQVLSGAYQADFDSNPDEPAHVVSSLMVHDYLASGQLTHAWEFATTYYTHYPKVAILHWPPLFHLSEAIWMFAAGRTATGLLLFQGCLGAALAVSVFLWLRRGHGLWVAFVSAAVLTTTYLAQSATSAVDPDLLLGLLAFWAAAQFGRYMTTGNLRHLWWFGLLALGALAAHGRGAPLLMVPVVALLLMRATRRRIAIATLVILAYLFVPRLLGQAYSSSPLSILTSGYTYLVLLGQALRWPVFALALIGIAGWLRAPARNNPTTAMIALLASCWIFHSIVNVPLYEDFLITAAPASIVLAAGGAVALWHWAPPKAWWRNGVRIALIALPLWVVGANVLPIAVKPTLGARRIVANDTLYLDPQTVWLIAGMPVFEGSLIAETALRDHAQEHILLRASKMLAKSSWSGTGYRLQFQGQTAISGFLDEARVGWVLFQDNDLAPHMLQLDSTLLSMSPTWHIVTLSSQVKHVTVFKRTTPLPGLPKFEIDMRDKFGQFFRLHG